MENHELFDLYFRRDLSIPVPPVMLSEDYRIITVTEETCKLWEQVMDRAFGGYEPGDFRYVMVCNFGYENDRIFLLCDGDGQPVATATSWWQPYKWGDTGIGEVIFVGVIPSHRGQGLARQMVNHVLHDMVRRGMHTASLCTDENNFSAIKTYLNCGFLPYIYQPELIEVWGRQFEALGMATPEYDRTLREMPDVPHPAAPYPYAVRMAEEAASHGETWVHGRWERHNMYRLAPECYGAVESWFAAIDGADIRLASILEQGGGAVFVDKPLNPTAAYMLGDDGFGYLAGSADCTDFIDGVIAYLISDVLLKKGPGDRQVILFSANEQWKTLLDGKLAPYQGFRIHRHTFCFDAEQFQRISATLPDLPCGYQILCRECGKFSIGVFHESTEAAACSEVFSGCGKAEIEVNTDEAYRRRGLALLACAGVITKCLKAGVTPHWSCWDYNEPSRRLALKLGFQQLPDLEVNFCEVADTAEL